MSRIFDGLLLPDHLANLRPPAGGPQDPLKPLRPEEEENLLSRVGNKALGGLHYVGSSLEKAVGGRAVRGLLGGHPGELASVIPFSDTLGITDEQNRVSGEDLLKQWGVLKGDGQKGTFEARDLAGPALEAALDPATYLSFGTSRALTSAGKAAEKAGTLAPTMAGRIAAGQAGLASFGLPFTEGTPFLTGATGEKLAARLGDLGDRALYSYPGRAAAGLFDPDVTVNGVTMRTEAGQRAARAAQGELRSAQVQARNRYLEAARPLSDAGILESSGAELRAILEGTASPLPTTPGGQALRQSSDVIRGHLNSMLDEARRAGRPADELIDQFIGFGPRQMTLLDREGKALPSLGGGARAAGSHTAHEQARLDMLRNFPGGTDSVNELLKDPATRGMSPLALADYVRQKYLGLTPEHEQLAAALHSLGVGLPDNEKVALAYLAQQGVTGVAPDQALKRATFHRLAARGNAQAASLEPVYDAYLAQAGTRTPRSVLEALQAARAQGQGLADWLPGLDPRYIDQQLDFFGNHALTDFGLYAQRHARAQAGAGVVADFLANAADNAGAGVGRTHIVDALQSAGLGKDTVVSGGGRVRGSGGQPGVLADLEGTLRGQGKIGAGDDLYNVFLPDEVARDAARFQTSFARPEVLDPVLRAWDTFTNLTKTGQTSLWPAFHVRNLLTGLWQNFVGHASHDGDYLSPFLQADSLRRGQAFGGAAQVVASTHPGLTDEQATKLLSEELFATNTRHGLASSQGGEAIGLGTHERPVPLAFPGTPGAAQAGLGDQLGGLAKGDWIPRSLEEANPLNVRGVMGREETKNSVVKAGQELGAGVDDVNRISAYLAFRGQGYAPEVAALKSKALHYDYSQLTPFEREVMRRAVPFYNWSRRNVPAQLERLITEPGGRTAAAVKGADSLRSDESGFVPEYLSQGLAIPVGKEEDGQARFLAHLGLPFEDLTQMLGTGPHALSRTGEKALGQLNPLLKGPLESVTGKQFYTGRDLEDLRGPTGNPLVDQVLMNSPLSRAYTTGRTLLDERKGPAAKAFNVLGPGRITDVDMAKQREIAARQLIEETLRDNPAVKHLEQVYVKPENLSQLNQQELELLRLYKTMEKEGQQRGREAKKGQQIGVQLR